jgi:hypothetical protein
LPFPPPSSEKQMGKGVGRIKEKVAESKEGRGIEGKNKII